MTRTSSSSWLKGFGMKSSGARLDRLLLLGADAGGDHDHGQHGGVLALAERLADRVSVHSRHDDVEQDQIRLLPLDELERLLAGGGAQDRVAPGDEHGLQQLDVLRHVVDDEDASGAVASHRSSARLRR